MACDFWPYDTAKLQNIQDTVTELLEEAKENPRASRGRAAAVLRGHLGRMTHNFAQLEQSLIRASEAPELFGMNASDLQRRQEQLQRLCHTRDEQLEVFRGLFSHDGPATVQLDPRSTTFANAKFIEEYGDSTTSSTLDDFGASEIAGAGYLEAEAQTLRVQDEQLSFLEGSVQNLKSISYAIKDEVDVHHRLLDATEAEVDKADAQLHRNKALLKKLMKRHSTLCLLLLALALLCLLVFLLVLAA